MNEMKPRPYDYAPSILTIVITCFIMAGIFTGKSGLIYAGLALLVPLFSMIKQDVNLIGGITSEHPAPQNATIIRPDGTRIPLELVYYGIEDDLHTWKPATPTVFTRGSRLHIEVLPPYTQVVVDAEG